jgi:hypothetical protein
MGRAIEQENSFLQVLLKLIPSEVIAVFIFIQGVMPRVLVPHLVIALLLVGITPVYLYWAGGVRSRQQLVISTLSLVVWVYAMGVGPFRFIKPPWYEPWHGAVALALWTLIPPMFLSRGQEQDHGSSRRHRTDVSSDGKRPPGAPRHRKGSRGGTRG